MSENPNKRERGFWNVFFKSDNILVLLAFAIFYIIAAAMALTDTFGDSGWEWIAGFITFLLVVDIAIIYHQTVGFFRKEDE